MRFGNIIANDFLGDGRQRNRYPPDATAIFDQRQVRTVPKSDAAEIVSELFRLGPAGFPELRLGLSEAVRQIWLFSEDGMKRPVLAKPFPRQAHVPPELTQCVGICRNIDRKRRRESRQPQRLTGAARVSLDSAPRLRQTA